MRFTFKFISLACSLCLHPYTYAATIQPGELLISEVMANPLQVSDTNGEWFELFNASTNPIDINGITISDAGSNTHEINSGGSLSINPGDYFVLGRNGDISNNGGYIADYVYNNFSLANSSDQIILSNEGIQIVALDYSGLPFGMAGVSAELVQQPINPSSVHYQLTQDTIYGSGDIGTPGSAGSFNLSNTNPVPIPGALWLFVSAIALFVGTRKNINPVNWLQNLSN